MSYQIIGACNSVRGKIRENNEDNFYFNGKYLPKTHNDLEKIYTHKFTNEDNLTYSVFDGMGGESNGELASFLASREMDKYLKEKKKINYIEYVNNANEIILSNSEKSTMGTTMATVSFFNDKISISNLGDSKIFLIRNNKITQVSKDHTDIEMIKSMGLNTKPKLTQHLGIPKTELELSPYIDTLEYKENDKILVCSDGVTDMINNDELLNIINSSNDTKKIVELITNKALENGGKDNITLMVFNIQKLKEKTKYLIIGISFILVCILITIYLIFKSTSLNLKDECTNLVEGDYCTFKFNEKKYNINIQDKEILEYNNGKIKAKQYGVSEITIEKNGKEEFKKTIKVFPK